MWFYRLLLLFLLCVSFPVTAQTPSQEQAEMEFMFERITEAQKSYLTQADVDVFLKVYKASKALKETDKAKWQQIEDAPMMEKEPMINKVAGLKSGESFVVSAFRVEMASRASDPNTVAEAKKEYEGMKAQLPEIEKQMASMPKEQAEVMRRQLNTALEMMRQITEYPAENIKIYKDNEKSLNEAIAYFDSE